MPTGMMRPRQTLINAEGHDYVRQQKAPNWHTTREMHFRKVPEKSPAAFAKMRAVMPPAADDCRPPTHASVFELPSADGTIEGAPRPASIGRSLLAKARHASPPQAHAGSGDTLVSSSRRREMPF